MGTVDRTVAILPFPDRLSGHVVQPCQFNLGKRGGANFFSYQMGRAGLAVQGLGHELNCRLSLENSVRKTCLALKNGQLRIGT
jgi:hypothetical protein